MNTSAATLQNLIRKKKWQSAHLCAVQSVCCVINPTGTECEIRRKSRIFGGLIKLRSEALRVQFTTNLQKNKIQGEQSSDV